MGSTSNVQDPMQPLKLRLQFRKRMRFRSCLGVAGLVLLQKVSREQEAAPPLFQVATAVEYLKPPFQ